jgi:hypothetical protein
MSKNGLILLTPTSIAYTGTSATISANGSVSCTTVGSISLNGVFSTDYDNYTVVIGGKTSNTYDSLRVRFRVSGTDDTTATYTAQYLYADGTTVQGGRSTANNIYSTVFDPTQNTGVIYNIYGPYIAQPTAFRSVTCAVSTTLTIYDIGATHGQSASYDGLTITTSQGTNRPLTGRVAVYGMRK